MRVDILSNLQLGTPHLNPLPFLKDQADYLLRACAAGSGGRKIFGVATFGISIFYDSHETVFDLVGIWRVNRCDGA